MPHSSQTTTSYRTGGSGGPGSDPVEDALLSVSSQAEKTRLFKKDAKRNGRTSGRPYDTGHTFFTEKSERLVDDSRRSINCKSSQYSGDFRWVGPLHMKPAYVMHGGATFFPVVPPTGSTAFYEVRAINRTMPVHPVAGLATALGELRRDGLPSLLGSSVLRDRTKNVRENAGSEYLNVEFGWKPMVKDLANTLYAVDQAGSLWRQYARDSGRIVRRRYVFPEEVETQTTTGSVDLLDPTSAIDSYGLRDGYPVATQTLEKRRKIWFSAGYSYYLPEFDNSQVGKMYGYEQKVNHLLGTRLTPEVVWNLAPWSWLSDWFGNVGDNISNATALSTDGLVIRWGYLMVETTYKYSYTMSGVRLNGSPTQAPASGSFTVTRKERKQASPFGFGLNPASFTGRQWAILAALGMTKQPRGLRQE